MDYFAVTLLFFMGIGLGFWLGTEWVLYILKLNKKEKLDKALK